MAVSPVCHWHPLGRQHNESGEPIGRRLRTCPSNTESDMRYVWCQILDTEAVARSPTYEASRLTLRESLEEEKQPHADRQIRWDRDRPRPTENDRDRRQTVSHFGQSVTRTEEISNPSIIWISLSKSTPTIFSSNFHYDFCFLSYLDVFFVTYCIRWFVTIF